MNRKPCCAASYAEGYKDGVIECEPYMRCWISIKDAVPPDERRVLISYYFTDDINKVSNIIIGHRKVFKNGKIKWFSPESWASTSICYEGDNSLVTLTHWMPLPEPPKF